MAEQVIINFLVGIAAVAFSKSSFEGLKVIYDKTLKQYKFKEEIIQQSVIEIDESHAIIKNEIKLVLIQEGGKWVGKKYTIRWYENQNFINVKIYDGYTNKELEKQTREKPSKREVVIIIEEINSPFIKAIFLIEETDPETIEGYVDIDVDYKNRDLYNLNVTVEVKNNTSFFIKKFPIEVKLSSKELRKQLKIIMGSLSLRESRAPSGYIDKKLEAKILKVIDKYEHRPLIEQIKRMTFGVRQPSSIDIEIIPGSPKTISAHLVTKVEKEPYFRFVINLKPFQSGAYRLTGLRENLGIDLIESREKQKKVKEKERMR